MFTNREFAEWLSRKGVEPLFGGRSIAELSEYNNFSLWWAVLSDVCLTISGRIVAFDKQLLPKPMKSFFTNATFFLEPILSWLKSLFSILLLLLQRKKRFTGKKKILFFSVAKAWREVYDFEKKETYFGDVHFDSVIRELSLDKYNTETITVAPFFHFRNAYNLSISMRRAFKQKNMYVPLEAYWSPRVFMKQYTSSKSFSDKLRFMEKNPPSKKAFSYQGEDLSPAVLQQLDVFFKRHYSILVKNIELVNNLIEKEKPSLIVVPNAGGWFWQTILISAKQNNVPVLTTQHSEIYPSDSYYYWPGEKFFAETESKYYPIPDIFTLYGPWTKKLFMEKFNYPEKNLPVIGQPRYDVLSCPKKVFDKKEFCKRYRLDPNKKIVLFATALPIPPFIGSERKVMVTLRKLEGIQVIIKPHPRGNAKEYVRIAREEGLNAVFVGEDSNVLESIFVSDAVITGPSTIVTEAILLEKPVVLINFDREKGMVSWVKKGVALEVRSKPEAEEKIKAVLFDEKTIAKLLFARKKFVSEHFFKLDGKATFRLAELIKSIIR